MICPNQIGSHFILPCTNPKTHAQITNRITNFLTSTFVAKNKYKTGKSNVQIIAEAKIHRFCPEANIEK
jgi:hypothetical protein